MSTDSSKKKIDKPSGPLTVFLPGVGAVATTFIAGVELVRKGLNQPIGSLTQMGTIRLGKRTEKRSPLIKDLVPLADLEDLKFAGWDVFGGTALDAARKAGVLSSQDIKLTKDFLQDIELMPAVFEKEYVKRLNPKFVKKAKSKMELAEKLREDIQQHSKEAPLIEECDGLVREHRSVHRRE